MTPRLLMIENIKTLLFAVYFRFPRCNAHFFFNITIKLILIRILMYMHFLRIKENMF